MAAAEYNITISQNADYVRTFQLKSAGAIKDITGYSFEAKVKKNYNESGGQSFTTSIENATNKHIMIKQRRYHTRGFKQHNR